MADQIYLSTSDATMSDYPFMIQPVGGDPSISYPAVEFRQVLDCIWTTEGRIAAADFLVSPRAAGANWSVDIAPGRAVIQGDPAAANLGKYFVRSTGIVNFPLSALANPATTRTHRLIIQILDKQYAGTQYGWAFKVLEDTGSGMPALPNSAISLASITLANVTASIGAGQLTDLRGAVAAK
ncbi:hypothetical protein ACIBSW_34610 [Actinoplanes sp. NPDC049668]|uniref:hypothetical protein n=1 Tax=unclassified Actinoplanes TaxID=2626549 RepID=UPI0033BD8128